MEDFDKWTIRRIGGLVASHTGDRRAAERTLARISLALPLSLDKFEAFESESEANRALIGALRDDRWIEREGDGYAAAHDVLADALAARWLFESDNAATERAADLLREAARHGNLGPALIALERLAPHPKFEEIDGAMVVDELVSRHPAETVKSLALMLAGSLLSLKEKLELLHRSDFLRERIRQDRTLDVNLSHLAAEVVYRKLAANSFPPISTLVDLLEHAWTQPQYSNQLLRRAYALDPARFRGRVHANIAAFPRAEATHFLLAQMLRSGEPPEALLYQVRLWLEYNGTSRRASHVYDAWLRAGGGIEEVASAVHAWIETHQLAPEAGRVYDAWLRAGGGTDGVTSAVHAWIEVHGLWPEARFIYDAWLDAGGRAEAVTPAVHAWIEAHGLMHEASYVYKAWLRAGAGTESVASAVLAWIEVHGLTPEAQFVYSAWLNAGGATEAVAGAVHAWIDVHGLMPDAQFVYDAWLGAGAATPAVASAMDEWLANHGLTRDASYFYSAWLKAGAGAEAVASAVLAWIEAHGLTLEAQFVYNAWLDADGGTEAVAAAVRAWIAAHGQTREASHVYKAWLDAAGGIDAVSDDLLAWVDVHGHIEEASLVYQAWLDAGGEFTPIRGHIDSWVEIWRSSPIFAYFGKTLARRHDLPENLAVAVIEWSRSFPNDSDALSRLGYICGHFHGHQISIKGLARFLLAIEDIVRERVSNGTVERMERAILCNITVNMFSTKFYNVNPISIIRTISLIVASGLVFSGDTFHSGIPLLQSTGDFVSHAVRLGLQHGFLDVVKDDIALSQYSSWLRTSGIAPERVQAILGGLDARFPGPAWRLG